MKRLMTFFQEMAALLANREQAEARFGYKYSPRAHQVLALAQEEATRLNHNFIGTEHLLLGIVALDEGVAASVLRRQGVDPDKLRGAVEKCVGFGPPATIRRPIPFTPRVKKALALAQRESLDLCPTYLGTEHILLGLMRENEGVASRVLKDFGLELTRTRKKVLRELDTNFPEDDDLPAN
jgi:ATP-dependent Clp protease ATP-binding subunit ClpC